MTGGWYILARADLDLLTGARSPLLDRTQEALPRRAPLPDLVTR